MFSIIVIFILCGAVLAPQFVHGQVKGGKTPAGTSGYVPDSASQACYKKALQTYLDQSLDRYYQETLKDVGHRRRIYRLFQDNGASKNKYRQATLLERDYLEWLNTELSQAGRDPKKLASLFCQTRKDCSQIYNDLKEQFTSGPTTSFLMMSIAPFISDTSEPKVGTLSSIFKDHKSDIGQSSNEPAPNKADTPKIDNRPKQGPAVGQPETTHVSKSPKQGPAPLPKDGQPSPQQPRQGKGSAPGPETPRHPDSQRVAANNNDTTSVGPNGPVPPSPHLRYVIISVLSILMPFGFLFIRAASSLYIYAKGLPLYCPNPDSLPPLSGKKVLYAGDSPFFESGAETGTS